MILDVIFSICIASYAGYYFYEDCRSLEEQSALKSSAKTLEKEKNSPEALSFKN